MRTVPRNWPWESTTSSTNRRSVHRGFAPPDRLGQLSPIGEGRVLIGLPHLGHLAFAEDAAIDNRVVDPLPGFDPHVREGVTAMHNTRDAFVAQFHQPKCLHVSQQNLAE